MTGRKDRPGRAQPLQCEPEKGIEETGGTENQQKTAKGTKGFEAEEGTLKPPMG